MTNISKFEQDPKRAAPAPGTATGQHRRQGAAIAGVGAAGMAGAAARNPLSHAVQHAQERRGEAQMASGRAAMATEQAKPRPAHTHLRGHQPDGSFVSATRARTMANADRNARIGQAAQQVSEGRRVVRAARHTGGKTGKALLVGGLVGAPLAYAGSRRAVKKSATKHDVDAAAAGATAGAVAYHGSPLLNEGREAKNEAQIRSTPHLKAKLERHQAAHGVSPRSRPGDPHYLGFFRNYPKDLPGSTVKRTLAHTHGGKIGMATQAAVVGGAAAGAVGIRRKMAHKDEPMAKSAFGVEHIGKADDGGRKKRPVVLPAVGAVAAGAGGLYADHRTNVAGGVAQGQLHHAVTLGRRHSDLAHQAQAGHEISRETREAHHLARTVESNHLGALKGVARNGKVAGHLEAGSALLGSAAFLNHRANKRRTTTQVAKAYQPGLITYHQIEADRQGRKKKTARNLAIGSGAVGAVGLAAHKFPHEAAAQLHTGNSAGAAIRRAGTAHMLERHGKTAAIAGGVGAAAAGLKWAHHAGKQNQHEKTAQGYRHARNAELAERQADREEAAMRGVSKSAFGVDEEIAKLGPPKVFIRESEVVRDKKRKSITYKPDTVETEHKGKTWLLRRDKYEAHAKPGKYKEKAGDVRSTGPRYQVAYGDAGRIHRAHQNDDKHITFGSGVTLKHRRKEVAKSAFGVEHETVEKFAIGEALKAGEHALGGLRDGLTGHIGPARNAAAGQGKVIGGQIRNAGLKLKPMVSTPKRAAAVAGGGALAGGYALGTKNG